MQRSLQISVYIIVFYWTILVCLQSLDKAGDSTLDLAGLQSSLQHLPGSSSDYIVVARNMAQWWASIDYTATEDANMELPSLTDPKSNVYSLNTLLRLFCACTNTFMHSHSHRHTN